MDSSDRTVKFLGSRRGRGLTSMANALKKLIIVPGYEAWRWPRPNMRCAKWPDTS